MTRWRELYLDRVGRASDRILKRLYAEAEAKEYECPDMDESKLPTGEELGEILDQQPDLSWEDLWPLEMDGQVRRDRARESSSEDPE